RNADRLFLHDDFLAGGDQPLSPAWRERGSRLSLGGGAGRGSAPTPRAAVAAICDLGGAWSGSAAATRLRCRPAAYQGPERRSDADAARPRRFAADQPVYDRHHGSRRRRGGRVGGPASRVADGLGGAIDKQLCTDGPKLEAGIDRGCGYAVGADPDAPRAAPASDTRPEPH